MYKNFDTSKAYFQGVAMAFIVIGATLVASGGVACLVNLSGSDYFSNPAMVLIGGLIVMALGYIHLELEMIRVQSKKS